MAVLNQLSSHTMVEGHVWTGSWRQKIMAVPTVFLNGEEFANGRRWPLSNCSTRFLDLLQVKNLTKRTIWCVGCWGRTCRKAAQLLLLVREFITGMVVETFSGQVMGAVGIENDWRLTLKGPKLMAQVEEHAKKYQLISWKISTCEKHREKRIWLKWSLKMELLPKAKTAVLSVGARWQNVNVPGEEEFRTRCN